MYCDRCGRPAAGSDPGGPPAGGDHTACAAARALEPPRFCADCGRRLVVQVWPRGWEASCAEHGTATGATG